MRIVAGSLKGRRLEAPSWEGLRPTSDKLRETLFNVLAPRIQGARMLDGYAGTGAVGIEALSRGAAHVTFVERDPRAAALIEANLERCGVSDRYAIIRARFAGTERPSVGDTFDVIFLDPPYGAADVAFTAGLADLLADLLEYRPRDGGGPERDSRQAGRFLRERHANRLGHPPQPIRPGDGAEQL